ncbi:metallopeptidase family protein [Alkalibacter mobilis]|uniref:metallopeptidase family protein n=1 Tax=Alkalibacter mobilis TaxID=2787712 RepID=UPI00189D116D|nr:metallopeptidase family protein [Alkalibacter mobilis]MBF7095558.1 metallopeptidase family protein [Alkalibacter mobilis]
MITIDEMEILLEEIIEEFPELLFKDLNGGIILLPEVKTNDISDSGDLFILGQYHRGGVMGRYITLYYGSFMRIYGNLSKKKLKEKLTKTLKHEFIHHLESMAGERHLEIEDRKYLENYLNNKKNNL